MKKNIGYVITLNIVLAMLIGGLINVNTVSAYQPLNAGDQLLYYANYDYYYHDSNMVLFENQLSSYDSYWDVYHQELQADEFHSYTVYNDYGGYTDGRQTANYIDTYRNDYDDYYQYNYGIDGWEYLGGYFNSDLGVGSSTWETSYNAYGGICNADVPSYFGSTVYLYNEMRGYTVNGIYNTFNCSVYYDGYGYSDIYYYDMYNISYEYHTDYSSGNYFYIDQDTGFILEYAHDQYTNDYAYFDAYADYTDIYCNVTYDYNYYSSSQYRWYLQSTTAAYGLAIDSDLPGIRWDWGYDYSIYGGQEYLTIYFDLFDSYSSCTIDVYLNDMFVETLFSVVPGYNSYNLYVKDLPIDPHGHNPKVSFLITDNSGFGHAGIYEIFLNDVRFDYPVINGPDYLDFKIGDAKTLYWELKDINNDPDYFELKFNGTVLVSDIWFDGKIIGFNVHDYVFSPGDYEVKITAVDMMGYTTYKYVTIHAYEDTEPTGTEPTGTEPSETDPGSNTVTLDAPNLLLAILGVLGTAALTVLIRRRK